MKLLGLRTLIYPTDNLEEDKKWWTDTLGFGPYFDQPFYVGFEVGGYELGLDPNADMAAGPRTYFGVDNVEEAVRHFVDRGCTIHEEPTNTGGDIVVATVKRPNGQLLGLIYNPTFKTV
jgi:predicted enzyme related to lactoylglutathione lyase